jgi:phage shock protein C
MKTTKSMSIGRRPFICEIDAVEVLDRYLHASRKALRDNPDVEEILQDLESSLAEHLNHISGSLIVDKKAATDAVDQVGVVSATDDVGSKEAENESDARASESWKRYFKKPLYKDSGREVIDGVCSGIARSLDIDPVWVRLGFTGLTVITSGAWILVYIALVVIMPEDSARKRRTASEIISNAKDTIERNGSIKPYEKALRGFVRASAYTLLWLARLVAGSVLAVAVLAFSVGAFNLMTSGWSTDLFGGRPTWIVYVCAVASMVVLFLPLVQLCAYAFNQKRLTTTKAAFTFGLVWFSSLTIAVATGSTVLNNTRQYLLQAQPKTDHVTVEVANGEIVSLCVDIFGNCRETLLIHQNETCPYEANVSFDGDWSVRERWLRAGYTIKTAQIPTVITKTDFCSALSKLGEVVAETGRYADEVYLSESTLPKEFAIFTQTAEESGKPDTVITYYSKPSEFDDRPVILYEPAFNPESL